MTKRTIVIDCDPGTDDAINLLLAFASPDDFDIVGITTVAGNVGLGLTTRNARIIRELAGREEVPVYAGCPRPLLREPVAADEIHGATGMDGMTLFHPSHPIGAAHGADFIEGAAAAAGENGLTIVATGPLTNVAVAIVKSTLILPSIKEIVLMGGARREGGNITPTAEFNIFADPHAAHVVFTCGRPIVAIGLDATHQALATPERIAPLKALGTKPAEAVVGMLEFVGKVERKLRGLPGAPVHDPCTIAYLLRPDLFKGRSCRIDVETGSPLTLGATSVDLWGVTKRPPNALWLDEVDAEGLFALLAERIALL
jgi:purine nucleosidase